MALTEASRRDLQTLTKDREKIVRELKRLQAENDTLVGRHSVLADQMASELINLPDTFCEDLIAAKLGKERAEEKLRSDVTQLKGLLVSEQQSKAGVERQLRGEIHDLHSKVATLEEIR